MERRIKTVEPENEHRQNGMSPQPKPTSGGQLNEGQSPRPSPQPKPAEPQKKK